MTTPERPSVTRRAFLRRTAAVSGAAFGSPYFVPGSALGADGKVAPSNRVTVGMIGVGRQVVAYNMRSCWLSPTAKWSPCAMWTGGGSK